MRMFEKDPDELAGGSLIGFERYVPDQRDLENREQYRRYREIAAIRPLGRREWHLAWGIADGCDPWIAEVTMTVERMPSKRRPETVCRMALFEGAHADPKSEGTIYIDGDWENPVESPEFRKKLKQWLFCKVAGALDYESPLP